MKKIIAFMLIFAVCVSLVACIADTEDTDEPNSTESVSQIEIKLDSILLDKLDEWVNITQPGTAGTSLKAITAVKDIVEWAKKTVPDKETMIATVTEFMENCEYRDEAIDAFNAMKNVFEKITDGTVADLMDKADFDISDFEIDAQIKENISLLFDAIEEYINQQE